MTDPVARFHEIILNPRGKRKEKRKRIGKIIQHQVLPKKGFQATKSILAFCAAVLFCGRSLSYPNECVRACVRLLLVALEREALLEGAVGLVEIVSLCGGCRMNRMGL